MCVCVQVAGISACVSVDPRGGCCVPCPRTRDAWSAWWLSAALCVLLFRKVDLSGLLVNLDKAR